ncbi:MAG: transporter substrate-binding domain-containing protein [Saccharospirillaceae bacterium]|nr:transporter substrate-binding domain-containing protein [Saccharospirillaceae bacterium]MCD8532612.1 transporter substrate-binding domain-containing protein [Saccharospirillaceae bacterium]
MRTGRLLITLYVLLPLLMVFPAQSEPVRMGTFTIPLMVESENRGVFIRLAEAVAEDAGLELNIALFPTRRVREEFAEQRLDMIFPAISESIKSPYLATTAVYSKRVFAFTRVEDPLVLKPEDMAGKRIGYTDGFSYSGDVLSVAGASYQGTITDPQNIKKLLAGRIDVFIGDERSALRAIAEEQANHRVHYERMHPLSEHPVFFAFQRTSRGSELHQRFNQALARMAADGRLAAILSQTR